MANQDQPDENGTKRPQGDPNANDFTANENAIGQAPNNRPATDGNQQGDADGQQ